MTIREAIRGILLSGAAGGSVLMAGPLLAAQAAEPTSGLQEIIVTAQRTETSLQQTPISVSAFSAETLTEKGATSLLDLGAFTPNLSVGSRAGGASSAGSFAIRGMGVDAQASSAAVGLYVDEVYYPAAWGNLLGLFDIERIEVLRGPQGTLFGRNTIAGAVQYVTVKPQQEFGGFVDVTGGNLERRDVQGAINVPVTDTFALRLSGAYNDRGGFVTDDFNGIKRGAELTKLGRLQARWTPTDRLTIDLKAEGLTQSGNGRAIEVPSVNPNAQFYNVARFAFGLTQPLTSAYVTTRDYHFSGYNGRDSFDFDYRAGQATIAWELTDSVTLKSISAYTQSDSQAFNDLDNTPLPMFTGTRGKLADDVFTQELQLSGRAATNRLNWTLGAYYYDGSSTTREAGFLLGPILAPSPGTDTDIDTQSKALYGQGTWSFTDRLSGTVGVRYSQEDIDGSIASGSGVTRSSDFNDTSPHVGLDFQATDDVMLYAKASKGFRAGGASFDSALGVITFDPETAWTYELGARMEFVEGRLRVNPTVFFTDWKDVQFNYLIPAGNNIVVVTQNAGDAEIKGAELEMQFAATDRLVLTASASFLDAKYTRLDNGLDNQPGLDRNIYPNGWTLNPNFNPADPQSPFFFPINPQLVTDLSLNDDLMRSPEFKYAIGGRYELPLTSGAKVITSLDWNWTDDQQSAVTRGDSFLLPSYGLLNARVRYESPSGMWNISAYGTNLTDEHYYIGGAGFGKGYTVGADELDPGRPLEYGVTLGFRF